MRPTRPNVRASMTCAVPSQLFPTYITLRGAFAAAARTGVASRGGAASAVALSTTGALTASAVERTATTVRRMVDVSSTVRAPGETTARVVWGYAPVWSAAD